MRKEYFIGGFVVTFIILLFVFFLDITIGQDIIGFSSFVTPCNFQDFFADFVNQVRITYDENIYSSTTNQITRTQMLPEANILAEKALPPLQYVILTFASKLANFSSFPTLFYDETSLPADILNVVYISTFLMTVVSVIFFILLYQNLKLQNNYLKLFIIITLLFSCPYMYLFQRGNIIIIAVLAVSLFLFNYKSENIKTRNLSLLSLGFAIAIKPLPLAFLILFLYGKRYKDLLKVVLVALVLTLGSFMLLNGGLSNIPLYIHNMICHQQVYGYVAVKFTFVFAILYLLSFLFKDEWKRCFVIAILIIVLVPRSYNFLYLFPVLILFLNKQTFSKFDCVYALLFIILLTPFHIFENITLAYISGVVIFVNMLYELFTGFNQFKIKKMEDK